ncbi:hypothetical protein KY290_038581 [Solanum tuberosum]|uniref:Protein kinase domain-containing protein n=3 Tax=Solanum tuberosum TaxID=4113 RepID=A0ABQ7U0K4_SOLTU|nr:hypothetical protein KY285_037922 [Solanum tuberosum]KAH0739876.1 hypothetical protein KY290_038581 [Solanum tuberosum]
MADGFDSHASSEFSNTKVQTFTERMKDEISISENSKKFNVCASETQEFSTHFVADESSIKKNDEAKSSFNMEEKKDDGSVRCSLKIEVIDDTAMIDISQVGKSCSIDKNIKGFDGKSGRNRKKKNANQMVAIKAKVRNMEEAKEKNVNGCKINGGEEKRVYCRKELENLRFVGMEQQRKMWVEVYCGLGDTVQKEYDGLVDSNTQKHIRLSRSRRHIGKENTPVISGNNHSEHLDDQEGNIDTKNSLSAFPPSRDDGISYEGENNVYEESDDSDDDYSSIQRPAFRVTGEPDFDSGPPEDGLEYLRRVRWEALRLPKVKVAAVQGSKLNKEQTSYMPQIPDIASCLEHLLPLKKWEEAFLADFSELRLALSRLEANIGTCSQLHSSTFVDQPLSSDQLPENIVLDKFDGLMSGEEESSLSDAGDDPALENSIPKSSPANSPTLSVILGMDAVARVSMLRKQITAVQSLRALTMDDCLWLFALCAAVDTPVDADTSAALRHKPLLSKKKDQTHAPPGYFVRLENAMANDDLYLSKRVRMRRWFCCTCKVEESDPSHENELHKSPKNNADGYQKGTKASVPAKAEVQKAIPTIEVPALSLDELKEETDNFGSKALIGEGSYGRVYYANLNNGKPVAVKKLDVSSEPETNVDFLSQVSMVSRLKHENLVELLGYCVEGNLRVLAYEFATMGSLHDILHGRKGVQGAQPGPTLDWMQRSPDMAARLHSTRVLGTFGYHAPEYAMTGQLTQKSDVYSFGVVLLELLTGRKPVDHTMPRGQQSLVTWATPRLSEDKVKQCIDPKMKEVPGKGVAKLAAVAALCVQYEAEFRPNMSIVVKALQPLLKAPAPES